MANLYVFMYTYNDKALIANVQNLVNNKVNNQLFFRLVFCLRLKNKHKIPNK